LSVKYKDLPVKIGGSFLVFRFWLIQFLFIHWTKN